MDVGFRASAVASARPYSTPSRRPGVLGPVELVETNGQTPLRALVRLTDGVTATPSWFGCIRR
jgi:hypothetical protein